jgi:hypothetical protein
MCICQGQDLHPSEFTFHLDITDATGYVYAYVNMYIYTHVYTCMYIDIAC